jgi:malate dehydrogenase
MRPVKIAIVGGAGGVGSSLAFNLLLARIGAEVVLIDPRIDHVQSHVMDLEQVLELCPGSTLRGGELDEIASAEVLVITAAVPLTLAATRRAYLLDNGRIVDEIAAAVPPGWDGVALMVTNPVDPLVLRFQRRTLLDRRRVLGYTLNDSLRLRTGASGRLGLPAGAVEAWSLGEHGEGHVPVFSRLRIGSEPRSLSGEDEAAAAGFLRTWFGRHVALDAGRTSTWTTGLGLTRMIAAIREGGDECWPASVVLEGEYGLEGVALTVPVRLGAGGATGIEEWKLGPSELEGLHRAAAAVRAAESALREELVEQPSASEG